MHPVGPEPSGVYWRRRIAVLLAVLLVLFAVWFLLLRGRGDASSSAASPSPKPTSTKSSTAKPEPSPSDSGTTKPAPACPDDSITVSVKVGQESYPVGSDVQLTMTIANSGDSECRRDIGAKANTILITSGGYDVWSSDDCNPDDSSKIVTMKPGDAYEVKVTWKGDVTAGSCPENPEKATAGSYDAQGKNGEAVSKDRRFVLTEG